MPDEVVFKMKWELAIDIIDQARNWGFPDRVIVADSGYGDATGFREALENRSLRYVTGISGHVGVWAKPPKVTVPKYSGRGQPPSRYSYGDQKATNVRDLALKSKRWKSVRWREGSKGWFESRFMAVRVQPSYGYVDGKPPHKELWLLVEWPEAEKEPIKYFLCDLPEAYTVRRLVRLAKARWKIEQDYQQLKEELGLDHYEGRYWAGWHHHVRLLMLSQAFLTLETLRNKINFWADPTTDAP